MDPRLRLAPIEFRAAPEKGEGVVEGYASVFDTEYRIGYGLRESIKKGAFAESLEKRNGVTPLFYQHNWDEPIGVARTSEDEKGVKVEGTLYIEENPKARSVWRAMKDGALREWSIGFIPEEITERRNDDDTFTEDVTKGDLLESSVVIKGANPDTTTTSVRSECGECAQRAADDAEAAKRAADEAAAREAKREIPSDLLARLHEPHVRAVVAEYLHPSG
jgi:HK97 family phage prohead protease